MRRCGVTPDEYARVLSDQGGVCAICGEIESGRTQCGAVMELAADHSHEDGAFRGILCRSCNLFVGHVEKDYGRLVRALDYLLTRRGGVGDLPRAAA